MIKLESTNVTGWDMAIHGMRNPMNSWNLSDSEWEFVEDPSIINPNDEVKFVLGPNDRKLAMSLANGGAVHAKYRRMIVVYVDITAPLYWWKEFDTYKVGTVANSCSTMHKIQAKEFVEEDFSCEHLFFGNVDSDTFDWYYDEDFKEYWTSGDVLSQTIRVLNFYRLRFLSTNDKKYWWQMIQLLPSSYNQKRTVMLNYEVLNNIYFSRKDHKLDEWHTFCDWIKKLPYPELIIGEDNNA